MDYNRFLIAKSLVRVAGNIPIRIANVILTANKIKKWILISALEFVKLLIDYKSRKFHTRCTKKSWEHLLQK